MDGCVLPVAVDGYGRSIQDTSFVSLVHRCHWLTYLIELVWGTYKLAYPRPWRQHVVFHSSCFCFRWQRFEYAHKRQLNPMTHIYFHEHFFAFNWNLCGKLKATADASKVSNRWRAQVLSKWITSTELLDWWTNLVKRVTKLDVTPTKATAWKSSTSHKLNKSLSRPLFLPRDRATCKR